MEIAALVLAICGCIFGLLGLVAAGIAWVTVIGWSKSTHKIEYVRPELPETRTELDIPQELADQLPSSPDPKQALREHQNKYETYLDQAYNTDLGD